MKSLNIIDKFIYCIINYGKIQTFIILNKSNDIDKLRKFHNFIKLNLIIDTCSSINANSLLDIACGRGGDLQKWLNNKINLKYILAFDSHKESIYSSINRGGDFDGAISRFQNIRKNYKGKMPFINFKYLNILDKDVLYKLNQLDSNKIYDTVSCQFALHYFCKNEETLNEVLSVVSKKLRKGGLFIGTATDGDLIHNILNYGNVNIPLLTLVKQSVNNYLFYIQTKPDSKKLTRQNYFEIQGVSSEFYLFKEQLRTLALKNNLELVEYKSFYEWYKIYKKTHSFNEMSIYEMIISFLNFSFIFKKK
jgi:mRNA (guanine-N7-)-methyltransferase